MRAAVFVAMLLALTVGIALAQGQNTAAGASCASWLQRRLRAQAVAPTLEFNLTEEEVKRVSKEFWQRGWEKGSDFGFRLGYAVGVIATTDALSVPLRRESHLKDAVELITAVDSLCASSPQKRLIDVVLYALGYR